MQRGVLPSLHRWTPLDVIMRSSGVFLLLRRAVPAAASRFAGPHADKTGLGEPGRIRTFNLGIKSPPLYH